MTATTYMISMVYLLSGVGVLLALSDDDSKPLGFGGLLIGFICVAIWPLFFMFALTTYFRSMAEQRPIDIAVRGKTDKSITNQTG